MQARSSELTPGAGGATGADPPDEFERACLLLLLGERPASAAELCALLNGTGLASIARPQVDAILRAFERRGLVRATRPAGPGRVYRLTPEGSDRLAGAADELRAAKVMLGWLLARCGERIVLGAPRVR